MTLYHRSGDVPLGDKASEFIGELVEGPDGFALSMEGHLDKLPVNKLLIEQILWFLEEGDPIKRAVSLLDHGPGWYQDVLSAKDSAKVKNCRSEIGYQDCWVHMLMLAYPRSY